jgi:putative aldouronate transport system substrate-binding protein
MKKQSSPDRVKELLRIIDYLAKPFGTQEDLLLTYGLSPSDYTLNADGDPKYTSDGINRSQYVPWQYISDRPYVQFQADLPGYAKRSFEVEQLLVAESVFDPTLGYYSPTQIGSAGVNADREFEEAAREIPIGRRPMSDLDGLLQTWRQKAGDQIRKEYLDAIAANK